MNQPQDPNATPDENAGQDQPPEAPTWGETVRRPATPPDSTPTGNEPTVAPGSDQYSAPPSPPQQPPAPPSQPEPPTQAWPEPPAQNYGGYQDPYAAAAPGQPVQPGQPGHPGQGYPAAPVGGGHPKSNTGIIIGIVVAVVLALGGVGIAAALLLTGEDDPVIAGSDDPTEDPTDEPTEEPSEDPTDEFTDLPTEEPTEVPPPDGDRFQQSAYSMARLDGWSDVTSTVQADNPGTIDFVIASGPSIAGARGNVIVERSFAVASDVSELVDDWRNNLSEAVQAPANPLPDTTMGGLKAAATSLSSTNTNGITVEQSVYLVLHDGNVYSVAFSAEQGDTETEDQFQEIYDSWSWD